jgi:hypothetical protein
MFFLLPFVFILSLYIISDISFKKLKIDNFEKPIFTLGLLILILNYSYFNLNIRLDKIFLIFTLITIITSSLFVFKKKKSKNLRKILIISLIIIFPFALIGIIYGEQFFVFRGNIYDHFVYLSSGLAFNSYNHSELINIKKSFPVNLENEFYLKHILNVIYYRPSVQLFIGFLSNIKFIDIIHISYHFKIITTILVSLGSIRFFYKLTNNLNYSIFLSLGFTFSFFYFYNFEIDAFSLIFFTPFVFILFSYLIEISENLENKNYILFLKTGFICALSFIIYPNGAVIIFVPIFLYLIYLIKFSKNKKNYIKNLFFSGILFTILIIPTYETTLMYLIKSEIPVGLKHKVDFWGYYGAFIFGKDNPIHNPIIVNEIKEIWNERSSIKYVLPKIISINIENNSLFFINIIPSILGFYHFSTSEIYGQWNYLLVLILLYLNIILTSRVYKNFLYIFRSKIKFNIFLKITLIFFTCFFSYLIFINQLWSAIKLYFILSPIFYILICFEFYENNIRLNKQILIILLMLLPIYKYSDFNNGIGKLDSFPSIIKKESKYNTKWNINREILKNCKNLEYKIEGKFDKIYSSLIFKHLDLKNKNNCLLETSSGEFVITKK